MSLMHAAAAVNLGRAEAGSLTAPHSSDPMGACRGTRGSARHMTWSIIARDAATGRIGIAVATKAFAVGALVPHIRTKAGAVASQAFVNPFYGPRGLALLETGAGAAEVV